jgi:hypothetical protein
MMVNACPLGHHAESERDVFLLALDSTRTPYAAPGVVGRQFTCFCAMDARGLSDEALQIFCSTLLRLGCAYLCTWGPDCKRVHDIMDRVVVGDDPPATYVGCVMTTWHAKDCLEDAIDYFLTCTYPDEDYAPNGCGAALIISVGSDDWRAMMAKYVASRTIPKVT